MYPNYGYTPPAGWITTATPSGGTVHIDPTALQASIVAPTAATAGGGTSPSGGGMSTGMKLGLGLVGLVVLMRLLK